MTTGLCVIGDRPHQAHHGNLCDPHMQALARMLREIEDEAAQLDAVPSSQHSSGRPGGLASHRTPARIDVLTLTDRRRNAGQVSRDNCDPWSLDDTPEILDVLGSWARIVREERELAATGPATVVGERRLLSAQLTWIAEQSWADELHTDLRALLIALQRVNGNRPERSPGRCYLPADTGLCNGHIRRANGRGTPWATLPDRCTRIDVETADGHAYCERCGKTWDGAGLALLNYELERMRRPKTADGQPMLSASELAARHSVAEGTIAVWAHRRGKTSVAGYYDPAWFEKETA